MEFLLAIIAAFFFYMVVLPFFGWLIGLFFRVCFPYSLGGLLVYLLNINPIWYLIAGLWLFALLVVRSRVARSRVLHWTEGHYQSAKMLLTLGLLMEKQVEEWPPLESRATSSMQCE